ncbi:hypothetical protein BC938DRAFT_474863 [Jimgerdemannia flammicorona]|uniref:Guanylate cyclase domain-containing protein n=1 Tax=Jimgerdemannia flammicorona TaxID=994334 RepID=A0A433QS44_9FUNG|nr:hypothetical protein BC938DRAFT_474863 [Jimgerdemannia flammicorona]
MYRGAILCALAVAWRRLVGWTRARVKEGEVLGRFGIGIAVDCVSIGFHGLVGSHTEIEALRGLLKKDCGLLREACGDVTEVGGEEYISLLSFQSRALVFFQLVLFHREYPFSYSTSHIPTTSSFSEARLRRSKNPRPRGF